MWRAVLNGMALLLRPPGCAALPAVTPDCNVAAHIDALLLGRRHLYPYPSCRRADPPCAYLDPEVSPHFISPLPCAWLDPEDSPLPPPQSPHMDPPSPVSVAVDPAAVCSARPRQ